MFHRAQEIVKFSMVNAYAMTVPMKLAINAEHVRQVQPITMFQKAAHLQPHVSKIK